MSADKLPPPRPEVPDLTRSSGGNQTLRALTLVGVFAGILPVLAYGKTENPLKTPFDRAALAQVKREKGEKVFPPYVCQVDDIPRIPENLNLVSRYQEGDPSRSLVDEEKDDLNRQQTRLLRHFESAVTRHANAWLGGQPYAADCTLFWLDEWARGRALLTGKINDQGRMSRAWLLAAAGSAYAQIRLDPGLEPDQEQRVRAWLYDVAQEVREDFSPWIWEKNRRGQLNNHLYWAAWAVGITGAALDQPDLYDWAHKRIAGALETVAPDGTLPYEVSRERRALNYHVFAAAPLVMMAELAQVNGEDLYAAGDQALVRLAGRILKGLRDPEDMSRRTVSGDSQDMTFLRSEGILAWLSPYSCHAPDRQKGQIRKHLQKSRRFVYTRLGGDLDLVLPSCRTDDRTPE